MANKPLKGINFPGLSDTYIVPTITNKTFTLQVADWSEVNGTLMWVDASLSNSFINGTLFVTPDPSSVDSYNEYINCGVRCRNASDGAITFVANMMPTVNLVVNVTSIA